MDDNATLPNLITDRTQADVNFAVALNNRVATFGISSLSEADRAAWFSELRGRYNASDYNRVGEAVQFISDLLRGYGYIADTDAITDWTREDTFTPSDAVRYLDNIRALVASFAVLPTTPDVPDSFNKPDYVKANAIEQILLDIDKLITSMSQIFIPSGAPHAFSGAWFYPVSKSTKPPVSTELQIINERLSATNRDFYIRLHGQEPQSTELTQVFSIQEIIRMLNTTNAAMNARLKGEHNGTSIGR